MVVVGTVLFAVGLVATLVWVWAGRPGRLGDGDWPWVLLAGTLLGLVGLRAVRRRKVLRRADVTSDPSGVDMRPNTP